MIDLSLYQCPGEKIDLTSPSILRTFNLTSWRYVFHSSRSAFCSRARDVSEPNADADLLGCEADMVGP